MMENHLHYSQRHLNKKIYHQCYWIKLYPVNLPSFKILIICRHQRTEQSGVLFNMNTIDSLNINFLMINT